MPEAIIQTEKSFALHALYSLRCIWTFGLSHQMSTFSTYLCRKESSIVATIATFCLITLSLPKSCLIPLAINQLTPLLSCVNILVKFGLLIQELIIKMKPKSIPSDNFLIVESKRTLGEKFRQVCKEAIGGIAGTHLASKTGVNMQVSKEIERRKKIAEIEDPIRTIMFLGSWNHT